MDRDIGHTQTLPVAHNDVTSRVSSRQGSEVSNLGDPRAVGPGQLSPPRLRYADFARVMVHGCALPLNHISKLIQSEAN